MYILRPHPYSWRLKDRDHGAALDSEISRPTEGGRAMLLILGHLQCCINRKKFLGCLNHYVWASLCENSLSRTQVNILLGAGWLSMLLVWRETRSWVADTGRQCHDTQVEGRGGGWMLLISSVGTSALCTNHGSLVGGAPLLPVSGMLSQGPYNALCCSHPSFGFRFTLAPRGSLQVPLHPSVLP